MMKVLRLKMILFLSLMVNISLAHELEEISVITPIDETTLFSHCSWRNPCDDVYKAILQLPNLNEYTELTHFNAFYVEGETLEKSVDELIIDLIAEAKNSNGHLEVRYFLKKQNLFEIEYGGGKFGSRPFCANVLRETVTIKFHNGLTLSSVENAFFEVPMEFCEFLSR